MNIQCIQKNEPDYPNALRLIADPPEQLFVRGDPSVLREPCVAIVGSRSATAYGKWAAYEIAKEAASHGITVVSGMAMGADSAAHRGALDCGGKTAAVLAGGVDICQPPSNHTLMERILKTGVILSESKPGTKSLPFLFPKRNRIISGLSDVIVVAEAAFNSGSLITAELAAEQGREVLAVPGNINSSFSLGTNKLLQDGALPVIVPRDILSFYGVSPDIGTEPRTQNLGRDEKRILTILMKFGEMSLNQLCEKTPMRAGEVAAIITVLEIKGVVQTSLGKIFVAKY